MARGDGGSADAPTSARTLGLFAAARRHGAYTWAERRLFALTGSWAAAPGLPDVARVHLFEASAQHAWHAELWAARLPVLAGVDPDELVQPADAGAAALLDALEVSALEGTASDPARQALGARRFLTALAGVVLPGLLASYRGFSRLLLPICDGPSIRALALVVADTESELAALGAHLPGRGPAGPLGDGGGDEEWAASLVDPDATDGLFAWEDPGTLD